MNPKPGTPPDMISVRNHNAEIDGITRRMEEAHKVFDRAGVKMNSLAARAGALLAAHDTAVQERDAARKLATELETARAEAMALASHYSKGVDNAVLRIMAAETGRDDARALLVLVCTALNTPGFTGEKARKDAHAAITTYLEPGDAPPKA